MAKKLKVVTHQKAYDTFSEFLEWQAKYWSLIFTFRDTSLEIEKRTEHYRNLLSKCGLDTETIEIEIERAKKSAQEKADEQILGEVLLEMDERGGGLGRSPFRYRHNGLVLDSFSCIESFWCSVQNNKARARDILFPQMMRETEDICKLNGFPYPWQKTPVEKKTNIFRMKGEMWEIAFNGKVPFNLNDYKGLHYIRHLLLHPWNVYGVLEFVGEVEISMPSNFKAKIIEEDVVEGRVSASSSLGDAGERLDTDAINNYKRRLKELNEEIEEAEKQNDLGRLEKLEGEKESILKELRKAFDPEGKLRKEFSHIERERVRVKKIITEARDKIEKHDQALRQHLINSIRTGRNLSYEPEKPTSWE